MTQKEIDKLFDSDEKENVDQLEELIQRIQSGTPVEEVIQLIRNDCENQNVADYLVDLVREEILPFEDTSFLREMDFDRFAEVVDYIVQTVFIYSESKDIVKENSGLSDMEIQSMIKLINTLIRYTIVRRYTKSNFEATMKSIFGFNEKCTKFLWDTYYCNREELRSIYLMRSISELSVIKHGYNQILESLARISEKLDDLQ